jgi:hypothetical protein
MKSRSKAFNRGQWQVTRERFHLSDMKPPDKSIDASAVSRIVPDVMKRLGLDNQHWLEVMCDEWAEIVGADVAKHTRPGGFQNKNLTIFVDGSVWLSELARFGRDKILSNLHKRFGADRIKTIYLKLDPGR